MPDASAPLEASALARQIEDVLRANSYTVNREVVVHGDTWPNIRPDMVAEDSYGFVVVEIYESWSALEQQWRQLQEVVAQYVTSRVRPDDPKVFEGYLALFCREVLDDEQANQAHEIRHDTSRVRKLVATGADLVSTASVERSLRPVLPLEVDAEVMAAASESVIDDLPAILGEEDAGALTALVDAFKDGKPLVEELHQHWTANAS